MVLSGSIRLTAVAAGLVLCLAAGRPVHAADALEADPEYFAAAASFSNGCYDVAIGRLLGLLQRYPRHPRLQMLLADAYERRGDALTARKLYVAALTNRLDPKPEAVAAEAVGRLTRQIERQSASANGPGGLFDLTAEQVAAMSVVGTEPTRRRTEHFDITTFNATLADVLAQRVEPVFERVRRTVLGGQLFAHRIELTVHPDLEALRKAHPAPHWSGGGFLFAPQPDGAIRRAVLLYQVDGQNRFRSTLLSRELPHELAHVVLREYFGQVVFPAWLDEGLACMAESDGGQGLAGRMTELLAAGSAVALPDMLDRLEPPSEQPGNFYVQSASWTRFLRASLADAQMNTFLGHLKDGQKPSVALGRTLFLDHRPGWLGALEASWHKSLLSQDLPERPSPP